MNFNRDLYLESAWSCYGLWTAFTRINSLLKFNENRFSGSGDVKRIRKTGRGTDEGHFYNPPSASRREINKLLKQEQEEKILRN